MFELLLTTGLSPRQIVEGQLEGLRRQFWHLRRIVVGLCVAMMLGGFLTRQWNVGAVITYVTVWGLFVAFCLRKEQRRVPSVMWVALITGRPLFALFRSKGNRVQWIWIMFNLRNITRGFRGGMGQFPTGSAPELILVAAVALIFAIVALAHIVRIINRWAVQIGPLSVSMSVSWVGFAVAALLAIWGFMQLGQ